CVAVRNIEVAIGCKGDVGGEIEGIVTGSGNPFVTELHEDLTLRIHFVNHMTRGIDSPNVVFGVYANGVRAAGVASRGSIDCRIERVACNAVRHSDRDDFALAEHAIAPRTYELPVAFEFHDWVGAAMQHENVTSCVDRHAGHLNEIPRTSRRSSGVQDLNRPFRHFPVAHRCSIRPEFWGCGRLGESNERKTKSKQDYTGRLHSRMEFISTHVLYTRRPLVIVPYNPKRQRGESVWWSRDLAIFALNSF